MKIDKRINKYKLTKSSGYYEGKKIPGSIKIRRGKYKFQIVSKANPDTNKKLIKYSNDYLEAIQILEALNNQVDTGDQKTSISTLAELSKDYFKYRENVDVVKNDIKITTVEDIVDETDRNIGAFVILFICVFFLVILLTLR